MKKNKNGSALILVLFAILILSMIGMAGLTNIGTDMSTARNFAADKTAFYAADTGINYGIDQVRNVLYPPKIKFDILADGVEYRTGELTATSTQPIKAFKGFASPQPRGISIEVGSETSASVNPWKLTISSLVKNKLKGLTRKQITTVIQTLSAEY